MQIGRYEVLGEIARGGFGAVYRARDLDLGREVAIKVLLDHRDEEEVERFLREGEAATRFTHPNVVRVHGLGRDRRRPYLVMDLISGPTLGSQIQRSGELPVQAAVDLMIKLAGAVEAAHAVGILHRDLKPANVLLEDGRPLLTDFGIARLAGARTLTQTGELLGTPSYMAPEQIEGDRARFGPPTDVYGLGAILYACLTGVPPFQEASILATMDKVVNSAPVPPATRRGSVDSRLNAICLRALARDPGRRFPSAAAFAEALEAWRQQPPAGASTSRVGLALGVVSLCALGFAGLFLLRETGVSRNPAPSLASPPTGRSARELLAEGRRALPQNLNHASELLAAAREEPGTAQAAEVELALIQVQRRLLDDVDPKLLVLESEKAGPLPEDRARLLFFQGRFHYERGGRKSARESFAAAALLMPKDPAYLAWQGIASDLAERGPLLKRSRKLGADHPAVLYLELVTREQAISVEDAADHLDRVRAAREKAKADPYLALIEPRLVWQRGDREAAIELASKRVEVLSAYPEVHRELVQFASKLAAGAQGVPAQREHWLEQAERALQIGLQSFPEDYQLRREQAWLLRQRKRYLESLALHQKLLGASGAEPELLLKRIFLVVRAWLRASANTREVEDLADLRSVVETGLATLEALDERLPSSGRGRRAKQKRLLPEWRAALRVLAGRILGVQRRWGEADAVLGQEVGGVLSEKARYMRYLNHLEQGRYKVRPILEEEIKEDRRALIKAKHHLAAREALEDLALRGRPLPEPEELGVPESKGYRLRIKLCEVLGRRPYDHSAMIEARLAVVEDDPHNLLAWESLLRERLGYAQASEVLEDINRAPAAIQAEPLIVLAGAEALSRLGARGGPSGVASFKEAEKRLTQVLELVPDFDFAEVSVFVHWVRRGKRAEALAALQNLKGKVPAADYDAFKAQALALGSKGPR